VRAVSGKSPDTTVSVETFENFSTVEYQYIVYSQLDNDATKFSTASGTVTIESESGGGGGGGAIEDDVQKIVSGTKTVIEGGESTTATVAAGAGETVRVETDTSSEGGEATVESVDIEFAESVQDANVQVSTTNRPPQGTSAPDSAQVGDTIGYVETDVEGVSDTAISRSTFTFRVSDQRLEQADTAPENVCLYRVVDGQPNGLPTEHLGGNRFQYSTPGFSVFVIGTETADISFVSGELDQTSVQVGKTFTTTATVRNDGGQAGEFDLTLAADGDTLTTETVTVRSDQEAQVDLSASIDQPGTYDITINGNTVGTLEVTEAGGPTTPETPAQTATPTPEAPGEETPTAEDTPTPTEAPGVFGPGFGSVIAILALLGAALLALRRES